jgi:hypothetical protein
MSYLDISLYSSFHFAEVNAVLVVKASLSRATFSFFDEAGTRRYR